MEFRVETRSQRDIDYELVLRAQSGDKRAFELLVIKYQHRVERLLSRLVRNPSDLDDVTQEAFIRAYRALPSFRGDSAFYTWLYRVAINTAKNILVSQGRFPQFVIDQNDDDSSDVSEQFPDYRTPETELSNRQIVSTVNEAVESLPEDLRVAITLRELDGLSYEDIAGIMNCPIGTVRSRIFRAREVVSAKLRPLLEYVGKDKRW